MGRKERVQSALEEAGWKPEPFPGGRTIWKRGSLAAECVKGEWEVYGQDGFAIHRGYYMPDEYMVAT